MSLGSFGCNLVALWVYQKQQKPLFVFFCVHRKKIIHLDKLNHSL